MAPKDSLRLPRSFIRSETPSNLMQAKVLRALIFLADKDDGCLSGQYEMPAAKFREMCNIHDSKMMREMMYEVVGKKYEWVSPDPDEGEFATPIGGVKWNKEIVKWEITRSFADMMRKVNASGYTYLEWSVVRKFSSVYALRIWELCKASQKKGLPSSTPKWTLEELRVKLCVPIDAYRDCSISATIQSIVTRPLKEVMEIGGLDIKKGSIGRGASAKYWFEIGPKPIMQQGLIESMAGYGSMVTRLSDRAERIERRLAMESPQFRVEVMKKIGSIPVGDSAILSYQAELEDLFKIKV